ncbi:hypothetical protein TWF281_007404 [Arthrobotrys megalospora]
MFFPFFSFIVVVVCIASTLAVEFAALNEFQRTQYSRPLQNIDDCSNSTHRWHSKSNGSCFDEESGVIPFTPAPSKRGFLDDYFGFVGLHQRDICGPDETTCWAISCCRPGEVCGSISEGCKVSWSTIYTTTITISWSTVTSWVVPRTSDIDYSTVTVNTTIYSTIFNPITLPGEGQDDAISTNMVVSTTLVLSAFTPPVITRTETVTRTQEPQPEITAPPQLMVRQTGNVLLPRADEPPRRSAGTSYTTLTVFVTTFFTTSTTVTLSNTIVEVTTTNTISSLATQNQTHYETPTGFTTMVITETSTSTSYAYGTVETPTQVYYITTMVPPSADGVAFDGSGPGGTLVPGPGGSRRFSSGAIAGLSIGLILAVALIVVGIVLFRRRDRNKPWRDSMVSRNFFSPSGSSAAPTITSPRPVLARISTSEFTMPGNMEIATSSPISELFFSGLNMTDENKYNRTHAPGNNRISRGSRGSMISTSVSPVPEEYILPETPAKSAQMRNSIDGRNWGRGYGGRGGYYNVGNRNRNTISMDFGGML